MARERTRKAESLLSATNFNRRTERLCDMEEFEQLNIFDMTLPKFRIDKPIRLIELFAGIGSQAMALRDLGADFEHYRVVEFDKFAITSYNAIHGTDFPTMDIVKIRGADLGVTETDKYCYIMTYSFPCQDLSVAGKQKGMTKGSGTRSGLLWEVERLLNEVENLPQVLVMENVPQVHSQANMQDFQKWIEFLESKGYSNYWEDLNAKDYGVAQNRERCIMVSLFGQWNFKFPQEIPLDKTMKDYLEDVVEEKYYIKTEKSQKLIQKLITNGTLDKTADYEMDGNFNQRGKVHGENSICRTILGCGHAGNEPKVCVDLSINNPFVNTVSNCITAKDRGISNQKQCGNGVVERRLGNIYGFDGGNYAGNVYDKENLSPTIRTFQGGNQQPMIVAMRGRNPSNPSDRTAGSPTEQRLEPSSQGLCNTLTSVQKDNLVMEININYRIRKLTPLECWRLMGFSDRDFHAAEKQNSNSQLYKQAGNSIVKDVLMGIFKQLIA